MKFYYYKITNIKNGSFYIGITTDPKKREHQHFRKLKSHTHPNYKIQNDYNKYGKSAFNFEVFEILDSTEELAYQHEYDLIQQTHATTSYNILEGGKLNPVYSPQVIEKLKETHQAKYDNILQYSFDGYQFHLIAIHKGFRDACRNTGVDFRAIQKASNTGQAHHGYYWIKENEKEKWLKNFLARFKCCVAKINETTGQIEDTSLSIRCFTEKYNTTYNKIYSSICQNNRCERKYKFIRITADQFAEINKLSL